MSLSRLSINSLTLFTVVLGLKCPILHHVREATSVSVVEQKPKPQGTQAHKRLLEAKFTNSLMIHKEKKLTYSCKNEWIYIRDFQAVQKTYSRVLSVVESLGRASSF